MHRLTRSLTRQEASLLLQVPPEVIDGLVESGRILCHVRGGEASIPLEQLEAFLRESLVSVYRAEAVQEAAVAAEWQMPFREPLDDRSWDQNASAPEPAPEPEPEAEPATVIEARPQTARPPIVAAPLPDDDEDEEDEEESLPPDQRRAARYVPRRQISGIFGDTKFTIIQMSSSGLRIRHKNSLLPGDEAKLSFALLSSATSFMMRARVVWTSVARADGETFSISGLRIVEHADRLSRAIDMLRQSHDLQPERRAKERRKAIDRFVLEGVSDEEAAAVMNAVQRFAADPVEASRWYGRARFALADEHVRREAPARPRDREEVLGIYEYLERQVEIPKIVGVMTWMRRTAGAPATSAPPSPR